MLLSSRAVDPATLQRCFEHAGFTRVRHVNRGGHEFILMEITAADLHAL